MLPAIVLSSHTAGLGVIRALGTKSVPVVNIYYQKTDMGYVSRYVKQSIFAPHPEKHEEEFIGLLGDYGRKHGSGLIIPADDATLCVVSRHKKELEKQFLVSCPEWEVVERIIDKKHTYALAERLGIPSPRTTVPRSYAEMERYGASIQYPCLVKPCESHRYYEIFRKKMIRVENFDELAHAYTQATAAGLEVMLQEFIPGDDSRGGNYNSYFCNGEPVVEFTAEKVRLSPPFFGVPSVVVSREVAAMIDPGRNIVKAIGFTGFSCTEFKRDPRDGTYKLMEVNGRHNRSVTLAVKCGINFPWIEYQHLVTGKMPKLPSSYRKSIYWIDEFRDTHRFAAQCGNREFPLLEQLHPYMRRHVCAVFDVTDPGPFLKRCADLLRSPLKREPAPAFEKKTRGTVPTTARDETLPIGVEPLPAILFLDTPIATPGEGLALLKDPAALQDPESLEPDPLSQASLQAAVTPEPEVGSQP